VRFDGVFCVVNQTAEKNKMFEMLKLKTVERIYCQTCRILKTLKTDYGVSEWVRET